MKRSWGALRALQEPQMLLHALLEPQPRIEPSCCASCWNECPNPRCEAPRARAPARKRRRGDQERLAVPAPGTP